ncbi:MAG: ABC transporter substrate-binding protein [Gammaproteobacteria bacterium]|nr:ABC transporter substrate-binding protein [Gammaproteobacteria bacterium]
MLLFILLAIVGLGPAALAAPPERISIQLKWTHGFQFAGYYAAIEKGYYAQAGLDVTLREIDLQRDIVEQVLSGEADYGTADSGLLVHHLRGEPVVLVNQIFQQSPLVLVTRADSGIVSPYQMIGKRIAFDASFNRDIPLIAMLTTTLGDLARVERPPFPANGYQALLDGDVT